MDGVCRERRENTTLWHQTVCCVDAEMGGNIGGSSGMKELMEYVRLGTSPSSLPDSLRYFKIHVIELELEKNLLVFKHPLQGSVPVITRDYCLPGWRSVYMVTWHILDGGKLLHLFSQRVFSPELTPVITDIVKTCQRFQRYNTSAQTYSSPVQRIESKSPFELVALDMTMFPRLGRGHLGCLVPIDHCSNWVAAAPLRSKTSASLPAAFQHRILPVLLKSHPASAVRRRSGISWRRF